MDANLGSLYREMGDLDAAVEWTERSFKNMSGADRKLHRPEIQVTLASLRASQKRMPEALALFRQAIDGADRAGNLELWARACNRLGEELLRNHFLPQAEDALLEAYRVRKLHHLPLDSSYRSLGRLRMEQGDRGFGIRAAGSRGGTGRGAAGVDAHLGHLPLSRPGAIEAGAPARGPGRSAHRAAPGARLALVRLA